MFAPSRLSVLREYVELLQRSFADSPDVKVRQLDLAHLAEDGVPRRSFDTVVCSNLLEHIEEDGAALAGMRDVLIPGGRVVLIVPALQSLYGSIDRAIHHHQRYSRDGLVRRVESSQMLVLWGMHPALGPIAQWGLGIEKNQIAVDTARFSTNIPGIFAVGDINTYPGKRKLILSGFHEAALAAFAAKEHLSPGEKVHLQYTTTSPVMHRRLGVVRDPDEIDAAA